MKNSNLITLLNPPTLVFGENSLNQFIHDFKTLGLKRLFIMSIDTLEDQLSSGIQELTAFGVKVKICNTLKAEPTFAEFEVILEEARSYRADSVAGIGGGSVMDTAKLVAAQLLNTQSTEEITGIRKLAERKTYLACIPTTAGTGSEVSPNALFVNAEGNKVGVISPYLVPDAAYIDPVLTLSVPTHITAATGIDALSHCLEAYTNKFAHPIVDVFALEGVRLVAQNLKRACDNGDDLEAKTSIALGSMYGGMCLGPVNTAAAHALAYPLGTDFHIAHGLSVSLMLPAVMEYCVSAAPERYAEVALALGAEPQASAMETARKGILLLKELIRDCGLPHSLSDLGIPEDAIESMATDAMKVQRLLKNSVREITRDDAVDIYHSAFNS
ncbi:iron-containing alcohol dehydrogenase [Arcticibacter sp.]|uniref:iron-containing alcohol dehydrogenase n=1 Tax=Arcticibacter sp. TaxID=1872630 RepID=UPI0038907DEC